MHKISCYPNHDILIVVVLAGREAGWGDLCPLFERDVVTKAQDGYIILICIAIIFWMYDSLANLQYTKYSNSKVIVIMKTLLLHCRLQ